MKQGTPAPAVSPSLTGGRNRLLDAAPAYADLPQYSEDVIRATRPIEAEFGLLQIKAVVEAVLRDAKARDHSHVTEQRFYQLLDRAAFLAECSRYADLVEALFELGREVALLEASMLFPEWQHEIASLQGRIRHRTPEQSAARNRRLQAWNAVHQAHKEKGKSLTRGELIAVWEKSPGDRSRITGIKSILSLMAEYRGRRKREHW